MIKDITFTYSCDSWDCETCGGTYTDSFSIKQGDQIFGKLAIAHCFGNTYTEFDEVIPLFCDANSIDFEALKTQCFISNIIDGCEYGDLSEDRVIKYLTENFGFNITTENVDLTPEWMFNSEEDEDDDYE